MEDVAMASASEIFVGKRQAAEICGYSYSYFDQLLKKYDIPRCGPAKNKFSSVVLSEFMKNPEKYIRKQGKKKGRAFKKVEL